MNNAEKLAIDASSILMNYSPEEDYFNPNSRIGDDFEDILRDFDNPDDLNLDADELLPLTESDLMLTDDRQPDVFAMTGQAYDPMDYLNKPDDGQYANGDNTFGNTFSNGNQQMVSNVCVQSQGVLVNNMNPTMQSNEVGISFRAFEGSIHVQSLIDTLSFFQSYLQITRTHCSSANRTRVS